MSSRFAVAAWGVVTAALLIGCGGDAARMLVSNSEMRDQVMTAITRNPDLAGQMIDHFMASDSTRLMAMNKIMSHGGAVQDLMARVARDPTKLDGVINLAVQDTTMRSHVLTLLKGIEMGAGTRPAP